MTLSLDDFDYALPEALIAQHPSAERTASRLLRVQTDAQYDEIFTDLLHQVRPGDLFVFNDTRVIRARLRGRRDSGGAIEVLIERVIAGDEALAHVRASHAPRAGTRLRLDDAFEVDVLGRTDDLYRLRLADGGDWYSLLERHGSIPLPPYITHPAGETDAGRYQTVYARAPGAVAAPTAGLHFDQDFIARLRGLGVQTAWVTLHVGAGTFQPVRVTDIADHRMHAERYQIPAETVAAVRTARLLGGRIWAVGTTSLRALEAAAVEADAFADPRSQSGPEADEASHHRAPQCAIEGDTRLFITPGYRFRVVDRLLTNFHLPRSTLMMLVSAFAGMATIRRAYAHAIGERYRFFSYGDAMLLERSPPDAEPAP